jgi:hypothetical protein
MNEPDCTIRTLVDDLTPTGGPIRSGRIALLWWITAMIATGIVMAVVQPFRPGFVEQLLTTPRFAFEIGLGLVVSAALSHAAFQLGIPDIRSPWRRARGPLVLLAAWLGLFAIAIFSPVLEPSRAGHRPMCYLEILLYAFPLTLAGLVIVRRWLPLGTATVGAWLGLAAGLIPASLMQIACMHEPIHAITWHLLPTLGTAAIGAMLGARLLRPVSGARPLS